MICRSFSECFLTDTYRISSEMTVWKALKLCFRESRVLAVVLFRITQYLWSKKMIWRLAPIVKRVNEVLTGFECHLEATVEAGLFLAHTQNIVVGEGTKIGKQVTLYNGVTLGSARIDHSSGKGKYPQILDGGIVYSGAKVLGAIVIGKASEVGANAVVLQDVPDGCLAVGVPARVIKLEGER
jgi:serine O-acetyltransferase